MNGALDIVHRFFMPRGQYELKIGYALEVIIELVYSAKRSLA